MTEKGGEREVGRTCLEERERLMLTKRVRGRRERGDQGGRVGLRESRSETLITITYMQRKFATAKQTDMP